MITHELMENITNYIFVFLLVITGILVRMTDFGTHLLTRIYRNFLKGWDKYLHQNNFFNKNAENIL